MASLLERVVEVGELGGDDQSIRHPVCSYVGLYWVRGNKPETSWEFGRGWLNLGGGGRGGGFFFTAGCLFVCLENNEFVQDDPDTVVGGGGAALVGTFISSEIKQLG